jgi:hypothetical protein
MAQAVEQRGHVRVKLPLKVSCIADYRVFDAMTENLSFSGALLKSPFEFVPGEDLAIVFNPPGLRSMFMVAVRVVWSNCQEAGDDSRCYQLGVKYQHLSSGNLKIYKEFLNVAGSA